VGILYSGLYREPKRIEISKKNETKRFKAILRVVPALDNHKILRALGLKQPFQFTEGREDWHNTNTRANQERPGQFRVFFQI
jgi:hypothetical protein